MAQDQSIEAARARIQRLVDEIAAISRKEMRSEDYFQQFLTKAVQATDGRGGAVWLVAQRSDGKSEFQLAAQVEQESSFFHSDPQQQAILIRALTEAVQSKKTVVSPPEPSAPPPGSMEAQMAQMQGLPAAPPGSNRTPYPFFHVPLMLKDQVLGVLQIWLQPYVKAPAYAEFVSFLQSLAAHVEQHLHSRRLGSLVMENQRLQHVLKFTGDLAGSLDAQEVARLAANYGRDLVGCERCSVLTLEGDRWNVLAISGQEVVEKKSSMVKALVAFVGAHAQPGAFARHENDPRTGAQLTRQEALILSKKELLARAEAASETTVNGADAGSSHGSQALAVGTRRTDEIDLAYFEHSHVVSATIAPLFNHDKEFIGAYFAESTAEGFFDGANGSKETSSAQRLTEWLAVHTGKTLEAARDHESLPFLSVSRRIRSARLALTGHRRRRTLLRTGVTIAVLLAASFYPKVDQVDGNCLVSPQDRGVVVPEVPGRVEKVLVREGKQVNKGEALAQLDTSRLETELGGVREERLRAEAEADRYRGLGDEAAAQISMRQAGVAGKNEEKILKDIDAATLRSPIDGVVMTKDLEVHAGEFIQAGTGFAEIAAMDRWQLQLEINERKIGHVEEALARRGSLDVNYILYSQSATKLTAKLASVQEISAMAYPREKEQVFMITLPEIQVPADVKGALRPGLTGRAKIELGREPTIWWLCKQVADWIRLKFIG